jgi:hypothetical protein
MITIRLNGGLGNQMFQFAAAFALARRQNCPIGLDTDRLDRHGASPDTSRPYLLDHFKLPPSTKPRSTLVNKVRRLFGVERVYREPHFHFDEAFFGLESPITLEGYFQSERYFSDITGEVRATFVPNAPLSPAAAQSAVAIAASSNPVAVHIRRGDFITNPNAAKYHVLLDADYYRRALQIVCDRFPAESELFLFSDDPDYVEQALSFVGTRHVIRGNGDRPWEDMALMAQCRHHVIANSSFSWWGAWLAGKRGQTVIAPRNWFKGSGMANNLKDLFPAGWEVI